jgi:hypothetical protein
MEGGASAEAEEEPVAASVAAPATEAMVASILRRDCRESMGLFDGMVFS